MMTNIQSRMARGALGWSIDDLAREAKVGRTTIFNFESGKSEPIHATREAIQRAFERAGVEFIDNGCRYEPREKE